MKILIGALIALAAVLPPAHAGESPQPATPFLVQGAYWTYLQTQDQAGAAPKTTKVRFTVEYLERSGNAVVFAASTDARRPGEPNREMIRPENLVFRAPKNSCPMDVLSGDPLRIAQPCRIPDQAGETWYTQHDGNDRHSEFAYRVLGRETVQTTAGTFDAIKLESWRFDTPPVPLEAGVARRADIAAISARSRAANARKFRTVFWFAPTVNGMVKTVRYFDSASGTGEYTLTEQLQEFGNTARGPTSQ